MTILVWKGMSHFDQDNTVIMTVDGETWANLPVYTNERFYSSLSTFEWNYYATDAETCQLAYAILRSYFEIVRKFPVEVCKAYAKLYHHQFRDDVVIKFRESGQEWQYDSTRLYIWFLEYKVSWIQ